MTACPFLNATEGAENIPLDKLKNPKTDDKASCPMGYDQQQKENDEEGQEGQARCPYGYDQLNKNQFNQMVKLGQYNCPACQSFFINAVKIKSCGHMFCQGCLAKYQQCPLCGKDIDELEPLQDYQTEVESFLQKHSSITWFHHLLGLTKSQVTQEIEELCPNRQSLFYLQLGQRSLSGGNVDALARFEQSLKYIDDMEDSDEKSFAKIQITAIIADLHMKVGQYDQAEKQYEESLGHIDSLHLENGLEQKVDQFKATTLNKLGDLYMYKEQYQKSFEMYEQGLQIRREALKKYNLCPFRNPSKGMEILISLVKLTDVSNILNKKEQQILYLQQAQKMAEALSKSDDEVIQKKVENVQQILNKYSC